MMMKYIALSILIFTITAGCASLPGSNQTQGTVAGGVVGAVLGSTIGDGRGQVIAAAAGALGGALIGSHIGKGLDERDQLAMHKATLNALEHSKSNSAVSWSNPDSGNTGSVTPTNAYQMADGNYCREYTSMVEVSGESETAYGSACRQPDGNWMIAS
ncbi:MAG: RT0821/Lpp0805 family surface protein [Gammaproteobacteria bacterium]